jgi:dUTPase-like protein
VGNHRPEQIAQYEGEPMAVLTEQAIKALGIIDNPDPSRFRAIGYDIAVGSMYVPEDDEINAGPRVELEYWIPPRGVVQIFSRETVDVPPDVCGYAMPKTGLCDQGILVLNTGILDPSFRGPVSAIAINFRKTRFRLKEGDVFLRLVFEETATPNRSRANAPSPLPADAIRAYRNEKMLFAPEYGATFLNVPGMVRSVNQTVTAELLKKERNTLLWIIGAAATLFAFLQIASPLAGKYFFSEETVAAKVLQELKNQQSVDTSILKAHIDAQDRLIDDLRRRVEEQARTRSMESDAAKRSGSR